MITNLELDHTDYFPNLEALQKTFGIAVEKVPPTGYIITNPNDPHIAVVLKNAKAKIIDYTQYAVGELLLPGEFNRENARAALCAARSLLPTLSLESGVQSLATFHGSWRRFEYKGMTTIGALVYDDYAHHPTEVRKTIEAARQKFSDPASAQGSGGQGKKIIVAFHPHLYSRTRDFLDAFASALATADEVVLAPIYPAREEAIPGVTSEILAEKITALGTPARAFKTLTEVFEYLSSDSVLHATSILITMGAGDIYKVAEQLIKKV